MCKKPSLSDDPHLSKRLHLFAESIYYSIIKINGQRILGPPKDWAESEPPKGSEVFIARIPNSYCEIDLYNLLKSVGKIYKIRWMINFSTLNRGFAFVKFTNPESARKAIQKFNNFLIYAPTKERPEHFRLGVVLSMDKTDLVLSPVPLHTPIAYLLNLIKSESLNVVSIGEADKTTDLKKVIIKFDDNRSAALARRCLMAARSKISPNCSIEWYHDPDFNMKDPSKFVDSSSSSTSTKKAPPKTRRNPKPIPQSLHQNIRTENKTQQIIPNTFASNLFEPLFNPSFASALNRHNSQRTSSHIFKRVMANIATSSV